jgi:hypothetical protein
MYPVIGPIACRVKINKKERTPGEHTFIDT